MILGSQKLYFVDKSLREQIGNDAAFNSINYRNITKIQLDKTRLLMFKIFYTSAAHDKREKERYHTVSCQNRKTLVNALECYIKIDHMVHYSSLKALTIDRSVKF
jgi:hypothetical protein